MLIPRTASSILSTRLAQFPAVAIIGARQTGKSTLLNLALPNATTFNLDLLTVRENLREHRDLLVLPSGTLVIDEIQKMPSLLEELKVLIDEDRARKGQFAISGSEQFQLMRGMQESLAGRLCLLKLYPLSWQELESAELVTRTRRDLGLFVVSGGYPELWNEGVPQSDRSQAWFESYLSLYIERDVCAHFGVQNAGLFLQFLRLVALRAGQLLNVAELSREVGASVPTLKEWFSILERSMIVSLVQPFHANLAKRLVKMPKIYFLDTGLLCHLLGLDHSASLDRHPYRGAIYENAVYSELMKRLAYLPGLPSVTFFRTHEGQEVDFIVERGIRRVGIEVKRSNSSASADAKQLQMLIDVGILDAGVVVTTQPDREPMRPKIHSVPFWDWSILQDLEQLGADEFETASDP